MGEYVFNLNSNVRPLSPADLHNNLNNTFLFFPNTMQDELLLDKPAGHSPGVKQQHGQLSPNQERSNTEQTLDELSVGKSKSEGSSPVQFQQERRATELIQNTSLPTMAAMSEPSNAMTSSPGFWSSGTGADDSYMQPRIPAVNGTLQFQNFPPNQNPLFNSSSLLGPQIQIPQQQPPSIPQQRRAITGQHHNFPQQRQQQQQQHQQHQQQPQQSNLFLTTKSYTSWSNPQQSTWSSPQSQANVSPVWNNTMSMNSVNRRSVPNLNPISPMTKKMGGQHMPMISPSKFRRSTSLPGKTFTHLGPNQPTFEFTGPEDGRGDGNYFQIKPFIHSYGTYLLTLQTHALKR
ncbi:PREDICTED: cytoplasmic polyadenylation element-binding protein 3-like isoform X2 [Priapulus caudatus]|uniref:Cytoplasmic polyadenylation element-binding protein 3-like isoform X2 n=1 Tax=Priapulus caudatus TaxID=37621 RepID=A0ABM1F8C8_PRICU|nr:PREDICTED: cytoplasmic polyadenylation element-binding protein 3-like isoform X2 [Priapulus caudatus]